MVNGWIRFLKSQDSKKCYGIFKSKQQVEQHQQKQNEIIQHNSRSEPDNFDLLSAELQKLIYLTPINKIQQALVKVGFKGRMQTNKMLLNHQLLQNIRTSKQINELINELK